MAQSQAKKQRQKLIREGKRSPEFSRSPFAFQDLRTRKTKTKQDHLNRQKYKNHASVYGDDGSFYLILGFAAFRYGHKDFVLLAFFGRFGLVFF